MDEFDRRIRSVRYGINIKAIDVEEYAKIQYVTTITAKAVAKENEGEIAKLKNQNDVLATKLDKTNKEYDKLLKKASKMDYPPRQGKQIA